METFCAVDPASGVGTLRSATAALSAMPQLPKGLETKAVGGAYDGDRS